MSRGVVGNRSDSRGEPEGIEDRSVGETLESPRSDAGGRLAADRPE